MSIRQSNASVRSSFSLLSPTRTLGFGAVFLSVAVLSGACDTSTGDGPAPESEPGVSPEGQPTNEPDGEPEADGLAMRLCILNQTSTSVYAQAFTNLFDQRRRCEQVFTDGVSEDEARTLCNDSPDVLGIFEEAVDGGRVIIDETKFNLCLVASRTARNAGASVIDFEEERGTLAALLEDPDCTGAFTGTRGENDACVQPWDCTGDLLCQASPPDDPVTRCVLPAGEDQRCGGSRTCADGLTCLAGRCEASVAIGRPCVLGGPECVDDSTCTLTSETPIEVYTCVAHIATGEACGDDDVCIDDGECVEGFCASEELVPDGFPCDVAGPRCAATCSVCRPSVSLGPTTCQVRANDGEACGNTDDCLIGLYCAIDTNACTPVREVGEQCNVDEPCADDLYCNAQGTCSALGTTDDVCTVDAECLPTHYCFNGNACRPRAAAGANCNGTTPCADGLECLDTVCQAGRLGDVCLVSDSNCDARLACIVDGEDCPPNDAQCIQDNPQGICAVPPVAGEACAGKFNVCDEASYCPDSSLCVAKLDAGVECEVANHCASGVCLEGGTCATPTPSCLATQGNGLIMMLFGALLPLSLHRRRRRRSLPSGNR